MERGSAAKGLMESCAGAIFASRQRPWALPSASGAHPFDGTTGGRGVIPAT
jgi:hypothetical protein